MKILYSCLSKSWGGMEMVAITGIKQLLKRSIEVELLCVDESRLQIEANNLGIIIHSLKSDVAFNPFQILKTTAIIRSGNFNLIHSHASKDLWFLAPALNILKNNLPLVFTKHVGSFIKKKDLLHNKLYNRVNIAIAISSIIKKNLIDTTSLISEKIKVIFNGVDINKFNPASADKNKLRNELGLSEKDLLIGMTGRFSPGKGHEEFLGAANKLNDKFSNLKFIIVGEASRGEDEYAKKVKQFATNLNLTNVYFIGYRSDIPDVLAAMDIFVFPSHAEAFGLSLVEAMAMNKPSVCSGSDGILDIAVDFETSLLFKAKSAADLEEKLTILISNRDLQTKFGSAARKIVIEKFDLEKVTDDIMNLYSNLIKGTM